MAFDALASVLPPASSAPRGPSRTTRSTSSPARRPASWARAAWRSSPAAAPGSWRRPTEARGTPARSIGLSIELPFEQAATLLRHLPRVPLLLRPQGRVRPLRERVRGLPGRLRDDGRAVEALTLIQTGKITEFPVVLVGTDYWRGLVDWPGHLAREHLARRRRCSRHRRPCARDLHGRPPSARGHRSRSRISSMFGEPVGQLFVVHLHDVLGVHLTRARQVERAGEHRVVGHGHLRVHEVGRLGRVLR